MDMSDILMEPIKGVTADCRKWYSKLNTADCIFNLKSSVSIKVEVKVHMCRKQLRPKQYFITHYPFLMWRSWQKWLPVVWIHLRRSTIAGLFNVWQEGAVCKCVWVWERQRDEKGRILLASFLMIFFFRYFWTVNIIIIKCHTLNFIVIRVI